MSRSDADLSMPRSYESVRAMERLITGRREIGGPRKLARGGIVTL